jgi:amino acid transporter
VPAVIAILIDALGARAGIVFSALTAMAMWFCGLSAVTWSSRVIWAFARDNGLPASSIWRQVRHKAHDASSGNLAVCTSQHF